MDVANRKCVGSFPLGDAVLREKRRDEKPRLIQAQEKARMGERLSEVGVYCRDK